MTSPTPASFETIAAQKKGNIRKPLKGTVLLGKVPTAAPITTLVATGGQIAMPSTYESVGWISEDGLTWSRDRSFSEVKGWGSTTVLRRDITDDNRTLQFAMLETKRLSMELSLGVDLTGKQLTAAGELAITIPDRPDVIHYRVVALGKDGSGSSLFYMARTFDFATVTDMDDETWSDGDDPLMRNVTLSAEPDDTTGAVGTEFIFGPGALAAATDMGYTVAGA